jgi:hypothetical protein
MTGNATQFNSLFCPDICSDITLMGTIREHLSHCELMITQCSHISRKERFSKEALFMKSATTAEPNPSVMVLESSVKVSDSSYKIDDSRRVGDTRFIKNSYVWYQFIERLSTLITLELIFWHLSLTRKLLLLTTRNSKTCTLFS